MVASDTAALIERAKNIQLVLFDVDGVLTDGMLYLGPDNLELKAVSVRDGLGLKRLPRHGVATGIISGRRSPALHQRMQELDATQLYFGYDDKLPILEKILADTGLEAAQVAFMGDDTPDIPLFEACGLGLTVADAHPEAQKTADWISQYQGGRGAVREASDWLLTAKGIPLR